MDRAYSILTVTKAADDGDERVIRGIATTPSPDRVGDIVEPLGVKFKNPLALLHQHDHRSPVGTVRFDKPTEKGVTFEARLPKIAEPGPLKDRVDTAWGEVKAGLVRAVSIGFRAMEDGVERMKDGGLRFLKTEILELSLVTIPANAQAVITQAKSLDGEAIERLKSIDAELRAASGQSDEESTVNRAASGDKQKPVVRRKHMARKSYAERIEAFEDTLKAKRAEMEDIMESAEDEQRTLDTEEKDAYDALEQEVGELREHIKRLKVLQADEASKAKPVEDAKDTKSAADIRTGGVAAKAKAPKLEPGIEFARLARVKGMAFMNQSSPLEIAKSLYGEDSSTVRFVKDAVNPGTTVSGNWAADLVGEETSAFADFAEFLRPKTIVGRFGTDGIPPLRRVPFNVALVSQTGGGAGYWVGEAKPKPLTSFTFGRKTLAPLKVANIAVLSDENIRYSSPSSDVIIRDELARALIQAIDAAFIDPSNTGDSGVKPASITDGAPSIVAQSTGDIDDIYLDVRALIKKFTDAENSPSNGVFIMSEDNAVALALMLNPLGQMAFPGMNMGGGTLMGRPVIVSSQVGDNVVMVNASDIYLGDEGGVSVDVSREASVEMLDGGFTQNPPTGSTLVSLWQNNLAGFRAERTINWDTRRTQSVAVLTGAAWGGAVPAS